MRIRKNDLKKIIVQEVLKFKEKDSSYYEDSRTKNAAGSLAITALMSSPVIFSHLQQIMRDKTMNLVEAAQYMILHFPQEAMHMIELLLFSDSHNIHEEKIIGEHNMKILKSQLKQIIKEEVEKLQQEMETPEDPAARTLAKLQSPEGMTVAELMPEIGPLIRTYGLYFKVKTNFWGKPADMSVTSLQYNLDRGATLPEDKVYYGEQPVRSRRYSAEREAEINAGLDERPRYSGSRYRGRYGRY